MSVKSITTLTPLKKEVQPIKDLLESIVVPNLRSNINIIPDHVTMLRGTKSKKQLTKKKTKKKSTLSRKEYKNLGLYTLPTKSMKYTEALPLHELWKGYFAEHLALNNKNNEIIIPDVSDSNYDAFSKLLMKTDLHGSIVTVVKSKCPNFVGLSGIVILDTKNTLKIIGMDNKIRTIPKPDCIFNMNFEDISFTLFGKHITIRPAERSVKKMKNFVELDL